MSLTLIFLTGQTQAAQLLTLACLLKLDGRRFEVFGDFHSITYERIYIYKSSFMLFHPFLCASNIGAEDTLLDFSFRLSPGVCHLNRTAQLPA